MIMLSKIKTRYIWLSIAICFLVAIGLIIGVTQLDAPWTTVVIVLLAIIFIYMTIAIQVASTRSFRYKPKKVNYPIKEFELTNSNIESAIKTKGYKKRTVPYGLSFIKVVGVNAYKIVLISDKVKYFEPNDESNLPAEKALEKCKRFIGFEIFLDYDEEVLSKLVDFNIQGDNLYYGGFYLQDNKLVCPNYVEPNEYFDDLYNTIITDLGITKDEIR